MPNRVVEACTYKGLKHKPFGEKEFSTMVKMAGKNTQFAQEDNLNTEKGIILTHKSTLFVTTKTNDAYKGKSVAKRLFNLELFFRENIGRDLH